MNELPDPGGFAKKKEDLRLFLTHVPLDSSFAVKFWRRFEIAIFPIKLKPEDETSKTGRLFNEVRKKSNCFQNTDFGKCWPKRNFSLCYFLAWRRTTP